MTGDLLINGIDAYTTWGVSLGETAFSVLMTPAPMKDCVEANSSLEHGKRVYIADSGMKVDERDLQLPFNIQASSLVDFNNKLVGVTSELQKGISEVYIKDLDTTYHFKYEGAQPLTFLKRIGTILIRFNEPNPMNRG